MSHLAERKEKDCLNCGTTIHGRFCHVCGQENLEPKESFWHLVTHFFFDITHFDGKFFTTLKDLLFKPGYLTKQYMSGRRVSYLHPIRMYVFTSAIFFLVFFALNAGSESFKFTGDGYVTGEQRDSLLTEFSREIEKDPGNAQLNALVKELRDTSQVVKWNDVVRTGRGFTVMSPWGGNYKSFAEYDSVQHSRPSPQRDGFIKRLWNKRALQLNEKYSNNAQNAAKKFNDSMLHQLPYLLFVSLPFFALILKLLYLRRRQFYYADHGIFSVHHYILSFILLLFVFLWKELHEVTGWGIWNFVVTITVIAWPVYLFVAMKRFYGQGYGKTFLKFVLLNFMGLIVIAILFIFFVLFSVFQL